MNHFERTAIFTLVENIEGQLRGLKTLIAASGNSGPDPKAQAHKVTATIDQDSPELSQDEEDRLTAELQLVRDSEIARMRKTAEGHFQKEWAATDAAMTRAEARVDG